MRRRDFIAVTGCCAALGPVIARAQQSGNLRRVGVLIGLPEGDPEAGKYLITFREALRALGWNEGQNVQIDIRAAAELEGMRLQAASLISLGPDLIVTYTTPATSVVRQATRSIPILFVAVSDPIGPGFVDSFSRPGGNITGFTNFEPSMGSKWLGLIRDIAPSIKRVAMMFNPATANAGTTGGVYFQSMKAAAQALEIELLMSPVNDPSDIDNAFAAMAERPGGGFIVMPNAFTAKHRERIVAQAERFRIPTVYPLLHFVAAGGLASYGIDYRDQFRLAASYADRILRGSKPADLPIQQPTRFELAINRKTATALGLDVPATLLALTNVLIE